MQVIDPDPAIQVGALGCYIVCNSIGLLPEGTRSPL